MGQPGSRPETPRNCRIPRLRTRRPGRLRATMKMRPSCARSSGPAPSCHMLSSVDCITTSSEWQDTRAGSYDRTLQTSAGEVNLKVPKLRRQTFETAIIERYRRRESSCRGSADRDVSGGDFSAAGGGHHRSPLGHASSSPNHAAGTHQNLGAMVSEPT